MQNLPKDLLRLLCHYLDWTSIFELSFACKALNCLSKDKKLFKYCVDNKYSINKEHLKKQLLLELHTSISREFLNIINSSDLPNKMNKCLTTLSRVAKSKLSETYDNAYYYLLDMKYGKNIVKHFLERCPRYYILPILDKSNISQGNIHESPDNTLNIILNKYGNKLKEYDVLEIDNVLDCLLIKNTNNTLYCFPLYKYQNNILPIQALKLLKIFNVKDKKQISFLYPNQVILGIMDVNENIYRFYDDSYNKIKTSVKLSYDNIEHEIYITK